MSNRNFLFFIPVIIATTLCGYHCGVRPEAPFTAYRNIAFGKDTPQQSMDVFLPVKQDSDYTPVFILVHGGAWYFGDKEGMNTLGFDTFFTAKGYAVITMNYRLVASAKYPAPVDDIGLVMDYIKGKRTEWKINPDRICILGLSSGAQLAMIYAYRRNTGHRIKAVMDLYGPTDLLDSTAAYGRLRVDVNSLLGPMESNRQAWHDASPLFYTRDAVPTAIFQSTADSIVHFKQSEMLEDSLRANGVPVTLYVWKERGHGLYPKEWKECRESATAWVKKYL